MKIIGISGSIRQRSYHKGLLETARRLLPDTVEFEELDLRQFPLYDADLEMNGTPPEIERIKHQVATADGVIIASPEYNYSYSGVLKNAIDWLSRNPNPLSEKPVAVVGASPGSYGTARGQTQLRTLLHQINAYVLPKPELLVTHVKEKVDSDLVITDEATLRVYSNLLETFLLYIERMQPITA